MSNFINTTHLTLVHHHVPRLDTCENTVQPVHEDLHRTPLSRTVKVVPDHVTKTIVASLLVQRWLFDSDWSGALIDQCDLNLEKLDNLERNLKSKKYFGDAALLAKKENILQRIQAQIIRNLLCYLMVLIFRKQEFKVMANRGFLDGGEYQI
ncbi:hypothetical protein J6590_029413 [Homalodisca vitripennis]|nr:hypothetical protein J6590_029413 [Homalodisca vitripennis]